MAAHSGLRLETTARYEIRIQGYLDRTQFDRLGGAELYAERTPEGADVTVFIGEFIDQAALAGALNLLFDLGFPLLSVQCLSGESFIVAPYLPQHHFSLKKETSMMKHGPIDVYVMAAGEPRFDGSVLAELERQVKAGTIRVLDLMVLFRDDAGKCWRLDPQEMSPEQNSSVAFVEPATRGIFDDDDAEPLYEGMAPGSAVFALAIEHAWAVDLVNALHDAGVEMALNFRVPAPIVDEAFASLATNA